MIEPIRVLHVLGKLNRGGAESMIMSIYRNIDRNRVQFDFVKHTETVGVFEEEIKSLGGQIYYIPRYTGHNHMKYIKKWRELFKERKTDWIVHGHLRSTATLYLKIAKKNELITIAHSHSTSNGSGISAMVKNLLQLSIKDNADYNFAASKESGKWLFGEEITEKENFIVFKNAVETDKFLFNNDVRNIKRKELSLEGKTVIGHVGNFSKVKNHDFLVDIYKEYLKLNHNSVMILIGEGSEKEKIKLKVHNYNLDNKILFLGSRLDVHDLLQAMDLFLFPSFYEGFPVSLVEAQTSGIKCVISDSITDEIKITSLIESISLEQSPKFWAEQINKYSVGYERKDMSEQIKKAGYDVETMAKWLEEFYFKKYSNHQLTK